MSTKEEHFQFNRWWNGDTTKVETPVQGSNVQERIQNPSIKSQGLKVVNGKVQKVIPEVEQEETIEITPDQQIENHRVLKPKTELNNIKLTL